MVADRRYRRKRIRGEGGKGGRFVGERGEGVMQEL